MKKLITSLILLLAVVSLHATDFTYEGINYTVLNEAAKTCKTKDGEVTTVNNIPVYTPGSNKTGSLTIPQTVINNGVEYKVVLIGKYSFANSDITSAVLPQTITELGIGAFRDCNNLIAINLPGSLKIINQEAFQNCTSLIGIDIPNSVTDLCASSFSGCTSLTSVKLSNSLKVLDQDMFKGCTSLTSIIIPQGIKSTSSCCFENCSGLATIEIPQSVDMIGWRTFKNCTSLEAIDISFVSNLNNEVFGGCSSLTSVSLSESLSYLPRQLFQDCASLENIVIPNSVSDIDAMVFANCTNLNTITLPASLKSLSYQAFIGCDNLTNVYCYATTLPTSDEGLFSGLYLGNANLYVPAGTKELYAAAVGWRKFGNIFDTLPVAANKIYLNRNYAQVEQKGTIQLIATIEPANTTEEIVWSSSDEKVATVSETGLVTAVSVGSATITVTCGNVSATCGIQVLPISAKEIVLNTNSLTIDVAGEYQLTATVNPEDATDKTITWTSSNPSVATVSESGLITAKSIGSAMIYAQCGYVSSICNVVVLPKSVSLDYQNVELDIDDTKQLTATVFPEASTNKTVVWESTNTDIVTVSEDGLVTAVAPGVAVVTATCDEGSAFCIFTVAQPAVIPEIKLSIKLGVSQTLGLSTIVSPDDTTDKIEWTSSNTEIAEVSEDGIVLAKAKGVAVITATCGELSTSIIFTIDEFSGISDVKADNGSDVVVYNLQGIRMNVSSRDELNNLPAGYYVVNNQLELVK